MKCSFIVSAFDRPQHLGCVLRSLQLQTERSFEVIVTDNAMADQHASQNQAAVIEINDERFRYERTSLPNCYLSANRGAGLASGEYLCFPSDDDYYVPRFLERMLEGTHDADLIYCDCLYAGGGVNHALMTVSPRVGSIDKGGFLVRRHRFTGFENAPTNGKFASDGQFIEKLAASGLRQAKVPGCLWIHNE